MHLSFAPKNMKGEVRVKVNDKFRYAEKCMYEYKRNMCGLRVLREDLRVARAGLDVHAQNYQYTFDFTGEVSNPVQSRLMRIESIEEKIRYLERHTKPITQLIEDLIAPEVLEYSENKLLMEIMKLMYFGKNPPESIMTELNIARRTYYRYRKELVNMVISYLAL